VFGREIFGILDCKMGQLLRKYKIYFCKIYFLKAILIVKPYSTSTLRKIGEVVEKWLKVLDNWLL
jgi:hypothetical protein